MAAPGPARAGMDKARKRPRDPCGDSTPASRWRPSAAPAGPEASDTQVLPGHRPEEAKPASEPQGRGQGRGPSTRAHEAVSDLQAGASQERQSSAAAAPQRRRKGPAAKQHKDQVEDESVPEGDPEQEALNMRLLLPNVSEEQLTRYEVFRRSAFRRASLKRLVQSAAGGAPVEQNAVIAMASLAKVFAGEVVEEALDVCKSWGEKPTCSPSTSGRQCAG